MTGKAKLTKQGKREKKGGRKMSMEVFQPEWVSDRHFCVKPKVSITAIGVCGFNRSAEKAFQVREGKHVVLFYDKVNKIIGFQLVGKNEEHNLPIRKNSKVSMKKLFFHYKINCDEIKGSYEVIEDGALLKIDLNKRVSYRDLRKNK